MNRNLFLALVFIVPLVVIFSQCISGKKEDPRGNMYAGSSTCIKCHAGIYNDYLHTAHFATTKEANTGNIEGSLAPGKNTYYYNKDEKVVVEKRDSGIYQVAYYKGRQVAAQRFDITFGGVKAQSYLYWKGHQLYQLPLSYFKALHSWANSPGFDSTAAYFNRVIGRRCFECHTSFVKDMPLANHSLASTEQLDKNSLILSIDCERCHGPMINHVNYHTEFPDEKTARYVTPYRSLSRAQKIDMCAVCHSGNKNTMISSTFGFKPGDTLSKFILMDLFPRSIDSTNLDVHGNQTQLLQSSQCYIKSNMDCATCHNVHKNDRGNLALFSQKCMACHTEAKHNFCPMSAKIGAAIKSNCIDCHMPQRSSTAIDVESSANGTQVPYLVRTHHIAVYPDAAQKIMDYLKRYNSITPKEMLK